MGFLVLYPGSPFFTKSFMFQRVIQDCFLHYFPFLAYFTYQEARVNLSDGLCLAKDRNDIPFAFHFTVSHIYCLLRKYISQLPLLNSTNRSIPQEKTAVAEIQYL